MAQRHQENLLVRAFAGRVAIVTGGTSGIGRTVCLLLGRLGATVVVVGLVRRIRREVVAWREAEDAQRPTREMAADA